MKCDVRWPANIKVGSTNSTTLFSGANLLPTLAGADVPDGIDEED